MTSCLADPLLVAPELGPAVTCVGYGRIVLPDRLIGEALADLDARWEALVRGLVADDARLAPHRLLAATNHRPNPLRYVWHHVWPRSCGGLTVPGNLAPLCDNCHYATHVLLWELANGAEPSAPHAMNQLHLATLGIHRLTAAGVPLSCVPKEAAG